MNQGVQGRLSGWGIQDRGKHVHPWLIHANIWQKSITVF